MSDVFEAVGALASLSAVVIGTRAAWLIVKRLDPRTPRVAPDALRRVEDRLAEIERSTDAIAVELERLAEGQRFSARLLSERLTDPVPPPRRVGQPERVITPH